MKPSRGFTYSLACALIIPLLTLSTGLCAALQWPLQPSSLETVREQLRSFSGQAETGGIRLAAPTDIQSFYAAREFRPAWLDARGIKTEAAMLLEVIRESREEALSPANYHYPLLFLLINQGIQDEWYLAQLDILLTDAFIHYGRDALGCHDTLATQLEQALTRPLALADTLRAMHPQHPAYQRLRKALAAYRLIESRGGWPILRGEGLLREGIRTARVRGLRQRLQISADLSPEDGVSDYFDETLDTAVKRFQQRHGLKVDGIVGEQTLAALNVPVEQRIHQLARNMNRWRRLPHEHPWRYLLINTAAYELHVMHMNEEIDRMRVIVGTSNRQTPSMQGTLSAVVLNPAWTVPPTILREDILPRVKVNPDYLTTINLDVLDGKGAVIQARSIDWGNMNSENFPYILRQSPGAGNPLGQLKFVLDNSNGIYLHDTPKRNLFSLPVRALSSGCIRLERPLELADYLLEMEGTWDHQELRTAIATGKTQQIQLMAPIPVYIVYLTAWVAEDGGVNFRDDIYARDAGAEPLMIQHGNHSCP